MEFAGSFGTTHGKRNYMEPVGTEELWSNHGPRIRANGYLIRFSEPPASRIFLQLRVNRVLSLR
jgi:hypothetical protein